MQQSTQLENPAVVNQVTPIGSLKQRHSHMSWYDPNMPGLSSLVEKLFIDPSQMPDQSGVTHFRFVEYTKPRMVLNVNILGTARVFFWGLPVLRRGSFGSVAFDCILVGETHTSCRSCPFVSFRKNSNQGNASILPKGRLFVAPQPLLKNNNNICLKKKKKKQEKKRRKQKKRKLSSSPLGAWPHLSACQIPWPMANRRGELARWGGTSPGGYVALFLLVLRE